VLVSQSKPLIEHYRRLSNDEWVMVTASGLESTLTIGPLSCVLRLSEVYDRVTFPEEPIEMEDAQGE
jgi:hypothetical protein